MSENRDRRVWDFSKYDAMATEELEQILRLDAESPEGQESNTELLLYIMEVLADRRKNTNHTGKTAQESWESFQRKYLSPAEEPEPVRRPGPWLRRLITAAAVIALVVCLPLTSKALGWKDFWNACARWAKNTFSFVSSETAEIREPGSADEENYSSLKEALEANNVNADMLPTLIPDRYSLDKIETDITPTLEIYRASYVDGDNVLRIHVQNHSSTDLQNIETEEGFIEVYPAAGIEYYIFLNEGQFRTVWMKDSYECFFSGNLSLEEVKSMIDSIGKGQVSDE